MTTYYYCLWYDKLWGPSQRVVTLFICRFCSTWFHLVDANIQYFEETLTLFFRTRTLCPLHLISVFLSLDILSLQACLPLKFLAYPGKGGVADRRRDFTCHLAIVYWCLSFVILGWIEMDLLFLSAFVAKLGQAGKKSAWYSCSSEETNDTLFRIPDLCFLTENNLVGAQYGTSCTAAFLVT